MSIMNVTQITREMMRQASQASGGTGQGNALWQRAANAATSSSTSPLAAYNPFSAISASLQSTLLGLQDGSATGAGAGSGAATAATTDPAGALQADGDGTGSSNVAQADGHHHHHHHHHHGSGNDMQIDPTQVSATGGAATPPASTTAGTTASTAAASSASA